MTEGLQQHSQHFTRIVLIFDNQDPARVRRLPRLIQPVDDGMGLAGQGDDKFTAFSKALTLSVDDAAVQLDNLADQRQSDAKPAGRPFQALAVLNKQFKNVRQHGRRNSASPILHFECDRFAINACGEMDGTARR